MSRDEPAAPPDGERDPMVWGALLGVGNFCGGIRKVGEEEGLVEKCSLVSLTP